MQPTTEEFLGTMFSIRSVQSGYTEKFSWNSSVESQVSNEQLVESWTLQGEAEKMALWIQVWGVNQRATAWPRKLKNLHSVKSVARILVKSENTSLC
jgi:hypothetical protein